MDRPDTATSPTPAVVDRDTWAQTREELLVREKAHTREGDAIAAARRRLPMVEIDGGLLLTGPAGPTPLRDLFEGHDQLILYKHMWHRGQPFEGQCEGCTATVYDVHDASYLHARGIGFAVVCEGPWEEVEPYVAFMGYRQPWYSADGVDEPLIGADFGEIVALLRRGERVYVTYTTTGRGVEAIMAQHKLLDMTVYGRQEVWEDSPQGWPQEPTYTRWRLDGRPVPQWTRPGAVAVSEHGGCHGG